MEKSTCSFRVGPIGAKMPRILLVGDYVWPWYQEICADSLERLGCEVIRFGWFDDFRYWREGFTEPFYHSLWHRIQDRLHVGPVVWSVQRRLTKYAVSTMPDIIWFYNVQLIAPSVVKKLRKSLPDTIFIQYANDNPFSASAKPKIWWNFIKSIPLFDVEDYKSHGAKSVHLLRSYFIPEVDHPEDQSRIPGRFKCDVVFAGHYEDDGRVELLEAICDAGYKLNIFGGGWDAALSKLHISSPLRNLYPITPVTNEYYRYAVTGAKVALCFLSTLNRDTYTRRSFQIPAMKVCMLSQFSDDLSSLYMSDKEVVFFRNKEELISSLKKLLCDDEWRQSVANAGYEKVIAAGHDIDSRMKLFLEKANCVPALTRIPRFN